LPTVDLRVLTTVATGVECSGASLAHSKKSFYSVRDKGGIDIVHRIVSHCISLFDRQDGPDKFKIVQWSTSPTDGRNPPSNQPTVRASAVQYSPTGMMARVSTTKLSAYTHGL
jgi:hypothetical protein